MAKLSSAIAASHSGGRLHQQQQQQQHQQVRSERVQVQVHEQQGRQVGGINMNATRAATQLQHHHHHHHHTRSSSLALTPKGRLERMQTNTREDHHQQEQQPRQPKPRAIAIKSARRELFAAPPQDCGGEERAANEQEKPPTTREDLTVSKWWRPCWNDGQLDGQLLFEQVRARHERRLLMASESQREISSSVHHHHHHHHHQRSQSELAGSQASCVYAVPRSSLLKTIQDPHRREPSADEDEEEEEEDPLSDPLYASVLGTSRQAQPYQSRQVESITAAANLSGQLQVNALAQHEMSSLVKSCLEVERATRNLLLVETKPVPKEKDEDEDEDELTLEKNKKVQEPSRTAAASAAASNLRPTSDRDFERNQEAAAAESWPRSEGQPKVKLLHLNGASGAPSLEVDTGTVATGGGKQDGQPEDKVAGTKYVADDSLHHDPTGPLGLTERETLEVTQANDNDTSLRCRPLELQRPTTNFDQPEGKSDTPIEASCRENELSCHVSGAGRAQDSHDNSHDHSRPPGPLEAQRKTGQEEGGQYSGAMGPKQLDTSENEIVIETSDLSQLECLKESPIRVREIAADQKLQDYRDFGQETQDQETLSCIKMQQIEQQTKTKTTQANRSEPQQAPPSDEVIKAATKCNELDKFFNHYKGESWRTNQLAYQIPHQDIKLLAHDLRLGSDAMTATTTTTTTTTSHHKHRDGQHLQTIGDEIKFIRGQRKMASQFKASLYYLNPTATKATPNNSRSGGPNSSPQRHSCFKCKHSIELGTTCVRVDNLMQARNQNNNGQQQQQQAQQAKCSSQEQRGGGGSTTEAILQEKQQLTANSKQSAPPEEKSSSDEGLGSGGSSSSSSVGSQSSSAAGSHCDERETPPPPPPHHLPCEPSQLARANPKSKSKATTNSCDNLNELSMDSLESKSQQAPANKWNAAGHKRNKSIGGEKSKLFSRKSRTLAWSASLGSLGASLKFGASSKSRSDTNLKLAAELAAGAQAAMSSLECAEAEPAAKQEEVASIFFHADCFSCATCNELLVDLRALIYVNDAPTATASASAQTQEQDQQQQDIKSEYVNLLNEDQQTSTQTSQPHIQLYCHRHFVELFKPRCQQCDCLILDEECTEAEGKVWHIKHFCCAECKVPLGGHQYIIVDQALNQARRKQKQDARRLQVRTDLDANGQADLELDPDPLNQPAAGQRALNQPYCLKCFDKTFGETCVQCGKLITCDSGAINHERRSWHASSACFRCQHCLKSLLGCPFLPSQDGKIFCSVGCSEMSSGQSGAKLDLNSTTSSHHYKRPSSCGGSPQQVNMSLAHYLDPRAMPSAVQHELELNKPAGKSHPPTCRHRSQDAATPDKKTDLDQQQLMRHKPLIDYLIHNAHTDETSYQLLQHLQAQLECRPAFGSSELKPEEKRLRERISYTIGRLRSERESRTSTTKQQQEQLRRNKLNPFLVEPTGDQTNNSLVCMMMDRMLSQQAGLSEQTLDYINLDCVQLSGLSHQEHHAPKGLDYLDRATSSASQHQQISSPLVRLQQAQKQQQQQQQQSKLSQCSPAASLISNEGTISDHSATSSGVSTAPPGQGSANGSLKSHSPLSSTSSHSSVVSSTSMMSSTSATKAATPSNMISLHQRQTSSQTSASPRSNVSDVGGLAQQQRQSPAICSVAATLERRRRVQPITELSVVDLLSVAEDQMIHQNRHLHEASEVGFDKLVSQFADKSKRHAWGGPKSSAFGQQGTATAAGQRQVTSSGKQQPDSFFLELAQRLPKPVRNSLGGSAASGQQPQPQPQPQPQQQQQTGMQVATGGAPLDTNGLPTVDDNEQPQQHAVPSSSTTARTITDHYSTVNKAHKQQQQQQQVAGDNLNDEEQRRRRTRDTFFAITSPLLDCQVADSQLTSATSSSLLNASAAATSASAGPSSQQHPNQLIRPTSSLSIFASGHEDSCAVGGNSLHGSYSTNSLNRQQSSQLLLQPTTRAAQQEGGGQQQKPLTRPAKSVSFDPNVKDPPSSTLGRASTLKSALRQTAWQQKQFACNELQQQQQQQPFMMHGQMQIASSATMPASFAAQLKAGSMAAYSAHYDEFGRRIKLSTLMQQQQQQQQQQHFMDPSLLPVSEQQEQLAARSSSSSLIPAGSLLAKLSGASTTSRGGRREERKLRQEEQSGPIVTQQPTSSNLMPPSSSNDASALLLQPSTSAGGPMQAANPVELEVAGTSRRGPASVSSSSSRRARRPSTLAPRSRRASVSSRNRRRPETATTTRRHHRTPAQRCNSRHCRDENCASSYDSDDYSSSCSTCSSESASEDDDDGYTDYECSRSRRRRSFVSRRHRRNHNRSRRYSSSDDSDSDYSAPYDSDDASSYTSYTSATSVSNDDHSSSDEEDAYDDDDEHSCSSSGSSTRSSSGSNRRAATRRRHNSRSSAQRPSHTSTSSSSAGRSRSSKSSKSSRSSDSTAASRSSSSRRATSTSGARRGEPSRRPKNSHERRHRRQHSTTSHHHSREQQPRPSGRRSGSHHRARNYHHQSRMEANQQAQPMQLQQQQLYPLAPESTSNAVPSTQQQIAAMNLTRSTSSMSNDSKSMREENCRII